MTQQTILEIIEDTKKELSNIASEIIMLELQALTDMKDIHLEDEYDDATEEALRELEIKAEELRDTLEELEEVYNV